MFFGLGVNTEIFKLLFFSSGFLSYCDRYVKKRFEDTKSLIYKCRHHMKAMSEHLAKCEEDGGGDPCNLEDEKKA